MMKTSTAESEKKDKNGDLNHFKISLFDVKHWGTHVIAVTVNSQSNYKI